MYENLMQAYVSRQRSHLESGCKYVALQQISKEIFQKYTILRRYQAGGLKSHESVQV